MFSDINTVLREINIITVGIHSVKANWM